MENSQINTNQIVNVENRYVFQSIQRYNFWDYLIYLS